MNDADPGLRDGLPIREWYASEDRPKPIRDRYAKLLRLRELGVEPYAYSFEPSHELDAALAAFDDDAEPGRVVRLDLDPEGRAATAASLVAAGLEELDVPTTAAIAPDGLHLVANSQLRRVGPGGGALPAEELDDILVLRFDLP